MSIFKRRRAADPDQVLSHLMKATVADLVAGTDESLEHAVNHLAADLNGLDRETLAKMTGMLILEGSRQSAQAIRSGAMSLIRDLLEGTAREEAQEPADGPEAPTDLQEDLEPMTDAQAAAEGVEWAEDRR